METLPSYKEIKTRYPLSSSVSQFIEESRKQVNDILESKDHRLLLIVGPCSIHDPISTKEYALKLKALAESVSNQFLLVMRVYCEKPRTSFGWKGFLYDPFLDGTYHIIKGIEWTRELLIHIAELQIPAATEFLDPLSAFYYDDLISWGSIGARTSSSPTHRQLASALRMPIGFKNGLAGNISPAVNGVLAASQPHTFMGLSENGNLTRIQTLGNKSAHIVLRGGESGPNYDPSFVNDALARLEHATLPPRLIIDCSHHNSNKKHEEQIAVFHSVIHQIVEGNHNIRGLMLESYLNEGQQSLSDNTQLKYGVSITDGCLDWEGTSHLIRWGEQMLRKESSLNAIYS